MGALKRTCLVNILPFFSQWYSFVCLFVGILYAVVTEPYVLYCLGDEECRTSLTIHQFHYCFHFNIYMFQCSVMNPLPYDCFCLGGPLL